MKSVFIVHHVREDPDGEEYVKLIGVFSSKPNALASVERHRKLPGFRDHVDGFDISEYELDKDDWNEGFG